MPKPDRAHQWTDEELERLERRISRVYREAWDDLEKTVIDYFNRFVVRDEEMRKLIGTEINGKVWTEHDYELWRLNQIGRGERFGDLAVKVAERYTKANEVALAYKTASDMGIKVRKRWVATKDGRTRHSHQKLDGQTVEWDEPFTSELGKIRYPGDPRAKPANVYNCRCTLRTVEAPGIEAEPRKMRVRDPKTGRNVVVEEMTYEQWERWVKSRA